MKLPFFGSRQRNEKAATGGSGGWLTAVCAVILVVLVVADIGVLFLAGQQSATDTRFLTLLDRLQVLSQTVAKESVVAGTGSDLSFRRLDDATREIDAGLTTLAVGNDLIPLPPLPDQPRLRDALERLSGGWQPVREQVGVILKARPAIINIDGGILDFESAKDGLNVRVDAFVGALQDAYAASPQLVTATGISTSLERISAAMGRTLAGGEDAVDASTAFPREAETIAATLAAFVDGGSDGPIEKVEDPLARAALAALARDFQRARQLIDETASFTPRLLQLQSASDAVAGSDASILGQVQALSDAYSESTEGRLISNTLGAALGAASIVMLLVLGLLLNRAARIRADNERLAAAQARQREEQTRQTNQSNQDAILRLLDEIGDLADGDLTTNATVTEDITGAIADAINFTIEALRDTVTNINDASVKMSDAARGSRDTALRLTGASEMQAEQIEGAASSIRSLAELARGVSGDATRGQEVATQQVTFANEGADAVRATIDGMDAIRETIQETSKRIKRLGESSQEIGDIVGLIDDIADQTNILALNAAIQASMAGEQGRGFAVVADEVQRLAERASQATKQIDGLVKAIQSDTNEAVASMEQSTTGVVRGAALAEDAGQALVRVELVSTELAQIVSGIVDSATGQTSQAAQVAKIMDEIQRITTEARAGTQETAGAIEALAQLATDLRTSVSGFQLPDSGGDGIGIPDVARSA
jgi:twitching motility protein PilJ